ncbi:MAG: FliO/MopB family protein [Bacillota bacterium]
MSKFRITIIFLILMFLFFTFSVFAAQEEPIDLDISKESKEPDKVTNIGGLLFRFFLSFAGVVLLVLFGVKFLLRGADSYTSYGDWIQIIDQMPLGTNKGIYLLEIEGKGYVIGVTDQQINVITTIEKEGRLDELRGLPLKKDKGFGLSKFNLLPGKKKNNFHQSLQQYIKQTQNLYYSQKKGDRNYEE